MGISSKLEDPSEKTVLAIELFGIELHFLWSFNLL